MLLTTLVNLAIAATLCELGWLMLIFKRRLPKRPLLANLMAGLGLLVAMRLSLSDAGWAWVALALAVAGFAHLIDINERFTASAKSTLNG